MSCRWASSIQIVLVKGPSTNICVIVPIADPHRAHLLRSYHPLHCRLSQVRMVFLSKRHFFFLFLRGILSSKCELHIWIWSHYHWGNHTLISPKGNQNSPIFRPDDLYSHWSEYVVICCVGCANPLLRSFPNLLLPLLQNSAIIPCFLGHVS